MSRRDRHGSVVVIGASHAAVHLADRLRAGGFLGTVTLIGREPHLPYQRPPLSKAWLTGDIELESLALRAESYYGANGIELVLGADVERVERDGDGVTVRVRRADGSAESRRFDRMVLATGARARRLTLPGSDHRDVVVLRELDDAQRLVERIGSGPLVVIGGGFVGLEVAATARGLGAAVTVIEAGPRILGRSVGAGTAAFLHGMHTDTGTDVLLDAVPVEIVIGDGQIHGVRLADGRRIPAATVLVGVGAEPRTELAEQLGLECDGGIVVDERCLASDGRTFATGDCTVQVDAEGGLRRLESVDNAIEQANTAAAAILGDDIPHRTAPWFWSDQGKWKVQMVGTIGTHTDVLVRSDPAKPQRRVTLYFTDDALVAAECVNAPADFVAVRSALARGIRPSPEMLSDDAVPLKKLLAAIPAR